MALEDGLDLGCGGREIDIVVPDEPVAHQQVHDREEKSERGSRQEAVPEREPQAKRELSHGALTT
jgi:hypothetical protein